jgi:hypothetical protein
VYQKRWYICRIPSLLDSLPVDTKEAQANGADSDDGCLSNRVFGVFEIAAAPVTTGTWKNLLSKQEEVAMKLIDVGNVGNELVDQVQATPIPIWKTFVDVVHCALETWGMLLHSGTVESSTGSAGVAYSAQMCHAQFEQLRVSAARTAPAVTDGSEDFIGLPTIISAADLLRDVIWCEQSGCLENISFEASPTASSYDFKYSRNVLACLDLFIEEVDFSPDRIISKVVILEQCVKSWLSFRSALLKLLRPDGTTTAFQSLLFAEISEIDLQGSTTTDTAQIASVLWSPVVHLKFGLGLISNFLSTGRFIQEGVLDNWKSRQKAEQERPASSFSQRIYATSNAMNLSIHDQIWYGRFAVGSTCSYVASFVGRGLDSASMGFASPISKKIRYYHIPGPFKKRSAPKQYQTGLAGHELIVWACTMLDSQSAEILGRLSSVRQPPVSSNSGAVNIEMTSVVSKFQLEQAQTKFDQSIMLILNLLAIGDVESAAVHIRNSIRQGGDRQDETTCGDSISSLIRSKRRLWFNLLMRNLALDHAQARTEPDHLDCIGTRENSEYLPLILMTTKSPNVRAALNLYSLLIEESGLKAVISDPRRFGLFLNVLQQSTAPTVLATPHWRLEATVLRAVLIDALQILVRNCESTLLTNRGAVSGTSRACLLTDVPTTVGARGLFLLAYQVSCNAALYSFEQCLVFITTNLFM